jgi:undecaprenyl-diphosphatase
MDLSLVRHLNVFMLHHDAVEDPLKAYVDAAELLFLGMLVAAFALAWGRLRRDTRRAVVAAGLSAGVALAIGKVISSLVDRERPFVAHPHQVHLFAQHAADAGFPSDHATASFAIAVALLLRFRAWGIVTLVAAVVLSVGRVALGIHYPTDVIGGAVLGTLVALVLHTPRVRGLLHELADRAGALLDAATGAVASATRLAPRARR